MVALGMLRWLGSARHTAELERGDAAAGPRRGRRAWTACAVTALYLALEPHVRRRWPESLVSWSPLLAGRVRDPMVGRDVLLGVAGFWAMGMLSMGLVVASVPSGVLVPIRRELAGLLGMRQVAGSVAMGAVGATYLGMLFLLLLLLCHALGRRRVVGTAAFALAAVALLGGFWLSIGARAPGEGLLMMTLLSALYLVLLTRVGLLAAVVALFWLVLGGAFLQDVNDLTGWPSRVTWSFLALNVAAAAYGLVTSVGKEALVSSASVRTPRGRT